ncbi:MAG TPA: carbon-nitrogen hydrolase family protein [Ohtaekwangia sp.]
MRIGVAQIRPGRGNIQANINKHIHCIERAVSFAADMIVFPELSLTSYEPGMAKELATTLEDDRFDVFQELSDQHQIIIGTGAPVITKKGTTISMILFQPRQPRILYSKKYLHVSEEPFFASGENFSTLTCKGADVALAICYETSVPQHEKDAFKTGAKVYVGSVVKVTRIIDTGLSRLSEIARANSAMVLMANAVGLCEDGESAGRSSVWNDQGILLDQLDDVHEGILVLDTTTARVSKEVFP